MDWGAFLIILALATLAGLYVGLPIVQHQGAPRTAAGHRRSALLARREQVLTALSELELDHETGKITEAHYQQRRQALLQEGAEILRELDALAQHAPRPASPAPQRQPTRPAAHGDDAIEALLAARRRARQAKAGGFCPQCGAPVLVTDRFCPRCGTPLTSSS